MPPNDTHLIIGGFNKIGFSNMQNGNKGTLDEYCGMERAFYFITLAIMYVHSIHSLICL